MKQFTLFIFMLFTIIGGVKAKNVYTTTTLWEGTDTGSDIFVDKGDLVAGATITLTFNWLTDEGAQFSCFYYDGGWVNLYNWQWVNNGKSYSFSLTQDQIDAIPSQLGFKTNAVSKMTFAKITQTVTTTETETSATTIWSGTEVLGDWGNLQDSGMNAASKSVKKGDVFRVTVTNASAGKVLICNASGWATLIEKNNVAQDEAQTIELEITDATTLEKIQNHGILIRNAAALTITKVELLTYASSYDCVSATIGSDGIATFSSMKKLDFTGTGVIPYYVSAVTTGSVTLTPATNATTWDYCGYILQGPEGTYDVPVTESSNYPDATYLKGQVGEGTVKASESGDTKFRYIFAKNSSGEIGFYKLTADHTLAAHKAYLETDTDITPASSVKGVRFIFSDDVDGVVSTESKRIQDDAIYTLSGVCVKQPKKGLYITNGHTVFVK